MTQNGPSAEAVGQHAERAASNVCDALNTSARQPSGPYVLGAVALGLVAYDAFMFVMASYRWIGPP